MARPKGRPKGSGKWGRLEVLYPDHLRHFIQLWDRAPGSCGIYYTRDPSSFLEFVEEIGPYPTDMIWPTVGRKDHSVGYFPGNFFWQEMSENSRESIIRTGLGVKGAGSGRTLSEATKASLSASHKNKPWSEARRKASRFSGLEPELVSDLMSRVAQQQPYSRAKRL